MQPSRRPKDGRYGQNPNRLQHYYQYQVVLKPAPANILELYLGSLEALGFDLRPTTSASSRTTGRTHAGCWGLGWEVWLNGMEVTQFTYFQQVGGIDCKPITGEITYGLERLAMYLQGVDNVYDLQWTQDLKYGDVYHQNEVEQSTYNFEHSDVEFLLTAFAAHEKQSKYLMEQQLALPAYEQLLEGRAHLQPAGCARRDQRDRARRLHRPHPQPARARGAELSDSRAAAGLPDGARPGATRSPRSSRRRRRPEHHERKNLLVELFVEELPPKSLKKLGEAFRRRTRQSPARAGPGQRAFGDHALRLAAPPGGACVPSVLARRPDRQCPIKADAGGRGLAADGTPTPALLKKLAAVGADASVVPALKRQMDGKAEACSSRHGRGRHAGRWAAEGAGRRARRAADPEGDAVPARRRLEQRELRAPGAWPGGAARCRRGAGERAFGLAAGRQTRGHRFEAQMDPVVLLDADHYARQLEEQGGVIPSFAARRASAAPAEPGRGQGGPHPIDDEALLDEVTALVERPNVLLAASSSPSSSPCRRSASS